MAPTLGNGKMCYIETMWPPCLTIVAQGGEIVQTIGVDAGQITARFRDPSRNVIGLTSDPSDVSALPHIARRPSRSLNNGAYPLGADNGPQGN